MEVCIVKNLVWIRYLIIVIAVTLLLTLVFVKG